MYQKKNRTKELARRTFVYTLMTLSLIILLTFLTFRMLGYTFDPNTKELQQTGLVQYESHPGGALVYVDDMELRRTPTKSTVLPGKHTFSMKLDKYEPWQKTLNIKSDTVTNLNYARLIPTKRETTEVKTFDSLQSVSLSPAGNFLLGFGVKDKTPILTIGDIRDTNKDKEKFTEHALSTSVLAGYSLSSDNHTFTVSEWDRDSRYALVKHSYPAENNTTGVQWLVFDRENPEKITDVTAMTGFGIKQIGFAGTGAHTVYALQETGELRRVDLDSSTISSPILTGVESFKLYGDDRLSYLAVVDGKKVAGIWKRDWKEPFVIGTFATDSTPVIRISRYFNKDTVVLTDGKNMTIYRGDISDSKDRQKEFLKTAKIIKTDNAITNVTMDNAGRFIVAQSGAILQTYDLERKELSSAFNIGVAQEVKWLDNFYIRSVSASGKMEIREFDGTNAHTLIDVKPGLDSVLSSNQRYVYGLTTNASGKIVLSKMNMDNGSIGLFN